MACECCKRCSFVVFFLRILYEASVIDILMILQIYLHLCEQSGRLCQEFFRSMKVLPVGSANTICAVANGCTRFRKCTLAGVMLQCEMLDGFSPKGIYIVRHADRPFHKKI